MRPHLEGLRFNKLKVIREFPVRCHGGVKWECLCDCGNTVFPTTGRLLGKKDTNCGKCLKNDIVGKKYGKLTVIKKLDKKRQTSFLWQCICDCGTVTEATSPQLKMGVKRSCGCLRLKYVDRSIGAKKRLFNNYKKSALKKNFCFELSLKKFIEITSSNCFYCGALPGTVISDGKINKTKYQFNGIDRMDNKEGYTEKNSVPCCSFCNMAKRNMPLEKFLQWGLKLSRNIKNCE